MRRMWLVLAIAGCTAGAPTGFSGGDHWVAPLVGPLEDGLVLVPASVNGKGPYVFAIDPDAKVSIVDEEVVKTSGLRTGEGPHMLDENDSEQPRFFAEVREWKIGTLTFAPPSDRGSAMVVKQGAYDSNGRRIHGVLGRDVLADSLVFGFDRDQGVLELATSKAFKPPPGAVAIKYAQLNSDIQNAEVPPIARRLVKATVDGRPFTMHVDLGATASQLRPRAWDKAKLTPAQVQALLVDEVGTGRHVDRAAVAEEVAVANVKTTSVLFVPFEDRRWKEEDIDGTLGLGFFRDYSVWLDLDGGTYYVAPRHGGEALRTARLGRWGTPLAASVSLVDPLAGKPADQQPAQHPGVIVSVVRDPSSGKGNLEALVAVTPPAGKPELEWLVANVPAGVDRVMTHLPGDYAGAQLSVVDVSPFPRSCPADGGCIDRIKAPRAGAPRDQFVAPTALEPTRTSGENMILPDEATMQAVGASGHKVMTVVRFCVDEQGKVGKVTLVQSSGFPDYDQKIVSTIEGTWAYKPPREHGLPVPACTQVALIFAQH